MVFTLSPEGFPTEMTLVRPLTAVYTHMHVQIVLLGECMATQGTYKRPLIPVEQDKKESDNLHKCNHILVLSNQEIATCEWL